MSCFNEIPNEICLEIYSYIPMCWPMLRKVNRRWRELLRARGEYTSDHYADWAAGAGYRVNMDKFAYARIDYYLRKGYHNILMFANYTWALESVNCYYLCEICATYAHTPSKIPNHVQYTQHGFFINHTLVQKRELMCAMLSKCTTRDWLITHMIIMLDDVTILKYAADKFELHKRSLNSARSVKIMQKLYEYGCRAAPDIISDYIKRKHHCSIYITNVGEYRKLLETAIMFGAVITSDDFDCAVRCRCKIAIEVMIKAGYKPHESQMLNLSTEMAKYVNFMLAKNDKVSV